MDEFVAWLWQVDYWHWWAIGLALVALEAFVASTYLLWPGVSAIAVGLVVAAFPQTDWRFQLLLFALLAVATSVGWQLWLRRHPTTSDHPTLNTRGRSYVGRRVTLREGLENGEGRVHLDDTWWLARSEDGRPLAAGSRAEIVATDGALLILRAAG